MYHVITTDDNNFRSIKEYNDDFTICHLHLFNLPIYFPPRTGYIFDVYCQSEKDYGYESDNEMKYNIIESPAITTVLDSICENIAGDYNKYLQNLDADDVPDESVIVIASSITWNPQIVRYMNSKFSDLDTDLIALDIFKMYNIVSRPRFTNIVKQSLGSEFVYPDDAVAFSYAVMQLILRGN